MLTKENYQTDGKNKLFIPACLVLFVSLRLLWALWAEQTIAEYLYLLSCVAGFLWMISYFFTNLNKNYNVWTVAQFVFTFLWCLAMFAAYEWGYHQTTVDFFGISMDSHARIIVYDFILLLPGIVFVDAYRLKLGRFLKLVLFALVITSLYFTITAVLKDPDALRMSMSEKFYDEFTELFYGLPDYSVVYAFSLLVPWLLYKTTQNAGKQKLFYFILLTAIVFIIVVSQFATALLGAIVGVVLFYTMYLSKKNPVAIIFVAFICFLLIAGSNSIVAWLMDLSKSIEGSWAEKLREIALFLGEGESTGDLGARTDYYTLSFQQFLKSPVLGKIAEDTGKIGGHSTFLDILGLTGLAGAVPFAVMVITAFVKLRKNNDDLAYRAGVWSALVIYLIFLFTKNIISAISINYMFFVILPILFFSEAPNEQNKISAV